MHLALMTCRKKPVKDVVDYAHLLIRNLNATASGLGLCSNNYKGEIQMLSFSEKSGFEIRKDFSMEFYYNDQQAGLNNSILVDQQYEPEKQDTTKICIDLQSI